MDENTFTFDKIVKLCITVAILVILFLITRQLSSVLLPFIVAWFVAYLLHPIVKFFQYKCKFKNRLISVITTLMLTFSLIILVVLILSKPIAREVARMSDIVSSYIAGWNVDTILPAAWQNILKDWLSELDLSSLFTVESISSFIEKISPYIGGFLGGSVNLISSLFVVFVCVLYVVFILIDYEDISSGFINAIPSKFRGLVSEIATDLENGMNKYFRGQAIIALTVGILFSIGFSIMRLPLAIVIGLFIGLLNMVPYLQVVGIPVCLILGILQSADTGTAYWIILLEIAVVFMVVQAIQDFVLNPLIMGNVIGMKPAVMLLSLSIFGSLFGIAGMIIALPVTTVIISYYKRYVLKENDKI